MFHRVIQKIKVAHFFIETRCRSVMDENDEDISDENFFTFAIVQHRFCDLVYLLSVCVSVATLKVLNMECSLPAKSNYFSF